MLCCGECFSDRGLSQRITELSVGRGICSFCETEDQPLIAPSELNELFGPLLGVYSEREDGRPLSEWLREDWMLFQHPRLGQIPASRLLAEILDDGEIVRRNFVPASPDHNEMQIPWDALVDELTHKNRFFPEVDFDYERLRGLFSNLIVDTGETPAKWYRARIEKEERVYSKVEMGAPPRRSASHGRANPAGIPYLYVGSKERTAVSEVRPHPGETVCVADFTIDGDVSLVDLRNPRQLISPFLIGDEFALSKLRGGDIAFLEALGESLTTPVLPNAAAIDYTGSQHLCEFIKKCGHCGVVYSSSVSDGFNLALFDPDRTEPGNLKEFTVTKVQVSMRALRRA